MTQTRYVDPVSGNDANDGLTLGTAWQSMRQAANTIAFETATEDYVIRCKTGNDPLPAGAGVSISFSYGTTSATVRSLTIMMDTPGDQHTGIRGTGYRHAAPLQFISTNSNITFNIIGVAANSHIGNGVNSKGTFDSCLAYDAAAAGYDIGGGVWTRKNCISLKSTGEGFDCVNDTGAPTVTDINCTALFSGSYGFRRQGGTNTIKNCYSGGSVTSDYNGTITKSNCAHSSASVFTGSTASVAYSTATVTNVTSGSEDPHLVSGSALIGLGNGPANDAAIPTVDFEGTVRSGATTDVGADQRTAAGTFAFPFRRRGIHPGIICQ